MCPDLSYFSVLASYTHSLSMYRESEGDIVKEQCEGGETAGRGRGGEGRMGKA